MEALITVIVPLYNKKAEVGRTLNSILSQTMKDFELIVVDDGSTDGSAEIVKEYCDPRIHLIQQENMGLPATRNVGIRAAKTQIITFLDADDEWYPNFLETILSLRNKFPDAGLYGTAFDRCVIDQCEMNSVKGLPDKKWEGYIPSYFDVYVKSGHPPFSSCCAALDKKVFDKVGYFNPQSKIGEDTEMWGKVAFHFPIAFTTKICARYHLVASNKMIYKFSSFDKLPTIKFFESLDNNIVESYEHYEDLTKYIAYQELVSAYFNIGAGDYARARKNLQASRLKQFTIKRNALCFLTHLPMFISNAIIQYYTRIPILKYRIIKYFR